MTLTELYALCTAAVARLRGIEAAAKPVAPYITDIANVYLDRPGSGQRYISGQHDDSDVMFWAGGYAGEADCDFGTMAMNSFAPFLGYVDADLVDIKKRVFVWHEHPDAQQWDGDSLLRIARTLAATGECPEVAAAINAAGLPDDRDWYPLGAIIAVADLVDCCPTIDIHIDILNSGVEARTTKVPITEFEQLLTLRELALGNFSCGRYGWVLDNVRPLTEPVEYRGCQGLFSVPLDAVRDKLPAEWVAKLETQHGIRQPTDESVCQHCGGTGNVERGGMRSLMKDETCTWCKGTGKLRKVREARNG